MKLRNRLELAPLSSGQALIAGGAGSTAFLLEQVIDRRLTQNRYDDLVLLGGMVSRYRRLQLLLGTLAHYTFGIALAVVYDAAKPALPRLPGWLRGLIFAQAEGVATGKGPGSAAVSLTRLGLVQYFDVVESGAAEGPIKPRSIQRVLARWGLSPQQAAYVGDSPFDVDAAHEARVTPIGAAWASSADAYSLKERDPLAVFESVDQFVAWLEDLRQPSEESEARG